MTTVSVEIYIHSFRDRLLFSSKSCALRRDDGDARVSRRSAASAARRGPHVKRHARTARPPSARDLGVRGGRSDHTGGGTRTERRRSAAIGRARAPDALIGLQFVSLSRPDGGRRDHPDGSLDRTHIHTHL